MKTKELINLINLLAKERKMDKQDILNAIVEAMERGYKKEVDPDANVIFTINETTGDIKGQRILMVVEDEQDSDHNTISLSDAQKIKKTIQVGEELHEPIDIDEISRIGAMHAKQVIKQKFSENQRAKESSNWIPKIGTVAWGTVEKNDRVAKSVIIDLGDDSFGYVGQSGQIPGEELIPGQKYQFFVEDVRTTGKGWPILLSRSHKGFVQYLVTNEVPEIQNGEVEVAAIARVAGEKTKIAVKAIRENIDAIGSVIGKKGSRVNVIAAMLKKERIDVVQWSDDYHTFIINALSPASVYAISVIENTAKYKDAYVIVPDDQLSLAIGKKGTNIKLACELTGWNLDVKSVTQAKAEEIEFVQNGNVGSERKQSRPITGVVRERRERTDNNLPRPSYTDMKRVYNAPSRDNQYVNNSASRLLNIEDYKIGEAESVVRNTSSKQTTAAETARSVDAPIKNKEPKVLEKVEVKKSSWSITDDLQAAIQKRMEEAAKKTAEIQKNAEQQAAKKTTDDDASKTAVKKARNYDDLSFGITSNDQTDSPEDLELEDFYSDDLLDE